VIDGIRRRIQGLSSKVAPGRSMSSGAWPPGRSIQMKEGRDSSNRELLRTIPRSQRRILIPFCGSAIHWIIANRSHSKNSLSCLGVRCAVRFAPFYDLGSVLLYEHSGYARVKMANEDRRHVSVRTIERRQWEKLPPRCPPGYPPNTRKSERHGSILPIVVSYIQKQLDAPVLNHSVINKLSSQRSSGVPQHCVRLYEL